MNLLEIINPPHVYIEIGQSSLQLLVGEAGLELPLDRQENGLLAPACKAGVADGVRAFLRKPGWRPRPRAYCAIGARGVSLRRLQLPVAGREESRRLLRLRIESEFPLPPDELAWGCRPLDEGARRGNGSSEGQEWVVAAVKKEVIEDYAELLAGCGLDPVFTLGALARGGLCHQAPAAYAILDLASPHTELIAYENGVPAGIRILPWGGEEITRALETRLGVGRDEAERLAAQARQLPAGEVPPRVQEAIQAALEPLAKWVQGAWSGKRLYLSGAGADSLAPWLGRVLGEAVVCEPLDRMPGRGRSAAILGLRQFCEQNGGAPPLILETNPTPRGESRGRSATWTWAVLALALALGAFSLRYTEAFLHRRGLARSLAEVKAARAKLPNIDREFDFLQYLKTNQPPYLEALSILAQASPPGLKIESLAMSRRGDLSLKGSVRDMPQTLTLRTNLIQTGFFSSVVFVEQTPVQNPQKMNMRLEAAWQPAAAREALARELARPESPPTNAPGPAPKPTNPK